MNVFLGEKRFIVSYHEQTLIRDVLPITKAGTMVSSLDDLERVVEAPLLKAMQRLFKKGLLPIQSSANGGGGVWFHLGKTSMDEENLEIAADLGFSPSRIVGSIIIPTMYIEHPLSPQLKYIDVQQWSLRLAEKFHNQRFVIE